MPVQRRRRTGILTALAAKKIRARRLRAKAAAAIVVGSALATRRKGRKLATLAVARRKGRKISARRVGMVKRAASGMR